MERVVGYYWEHSNFLILPSIVAFAFLLIILLIKRKRLSWEEFREYKKNVVQMVIFSFMLIYAIVFGIHIASNDKPFGYDRWESAAVVTIFFIIFIIINDKIHVLEDNLDNGYS